MYFDLLSLGLRNSSLIETKIFKYNFVVIIINFTRLRTRQIKKVESWHDKIIFAELSLKNKIMFIDKQR